MFLAFLAMKLLRISYVVFHWKCLQIYIIIIIIIIDRISLCSPAWPTTCRVDQAGPKLRDPPTSNSPNQRQVPLYQTHRLFWKVFSDFTVHSWQSLSLSAFRVAFHCRLPQKRRCPFSCWAAFSFAILQIFLLVLSLTILISKCLGVSLLFGGCSAS